MLLTEQVTGTYRTLPGCHTLLRDRLKSFQRREMAGINNCINHDQMTNAMPTTSCHPPSFIGLNDIP